MLTAYQQCRHYLKRKIGLNYLQKRVHKNVGAYCTHAHSDLQLSLRYTQIPKYATYSEFHLVLTHIYSVAEKRQGYIHQIQNNAYIFANHLDTFSNPTISTQYTDTV